MNKQEDFDVALDELTPKQKKVLRLFLDGKTDKDIAKFMDDITPSAVRHQRGNICKKFGIKNEEGQRLSLRDELRDLFAKYKPDWVNPEILKQFNSRLQIVPELANQNDSVPLNSPDYIDRPEMEPTASTPEVTPIVGTQLTLPVRRYPKVKRTP